jgi:hypothetical protein
MIAGYSIPGRISAIATDASPLIDHPAGFAALVSFAPAR